MGLNYSLSGRKRYSLQIIKELLKRPMCGLSGISPENEHNYQFSESVQATYFNNKLSHNGITSYKVFEGFDRRIRLSSLSNLHNQKSSDSSYVAELTELFKLSQSDGERSSVIDQAISDLTYEDYQAFLSRTYLTRNLNPAQSRKIQSLCKKLTYYSAARRFSSKKSGKYSMKVAFLTLTAPESAMPSQMLAAFDHFLDYLRRTANCVYVWKKELGELGSRLHFHVMVNNFIPYYIVDWKWKRLLINEGIQWPVGEDGKPTSSHYRIELPRSSKKVSHYISKYMSKAYALPSDYGFISGHSKLLDTCAEIRLIESDIPIDELEAIMASHKIIRSEFMSHVCVDLLHVKHIAPKIGALFEEQYIKFSEILTLPQKFYDC